MGTELRTYPLTAGQRQALLLSLYSQDVQQRLEAIHKTRALPLNDAELIKL
jgi:hypothetical protein